MSDPVTNLLADLDAQDPHSLWASLRPRLIGTREGFPAQALGMAWMAKDKLADLWLAELQSFAQDRSLVSGENFALHLHIIVLLAAAKDQRAFAPLLDLCRLNEADSDVIFGDFATVVVGRALAAVCRNADVPALIAFADDQAISVWLRCSAISAISMRALEGDADRIETAQTLLAWGEAEAERLRNGQSYESELLGLVVSELCELCYVEAEPIIEQWQADDVVDAELYRSMDEVRSDIRRDFADSAAQLRKAGLLYIQDVCAEMRDWIMFDPDFEGDNKFAFEDDFDVDGFAPVEQPFVRDTPKLGRNDPCWCGSGKKYKKCCGA